MARRLKIPSFGALARSYQRNLRAIARTAKLVGAPAPKKRAANTKQPSAPRKASVRAASSGAQNVAALQAGARVAKGAFSSAATAVAGAPVRPKSSRAALPQALGKWIGGIAPGPAGARRYHLFVPPGVSTASRVRLPLLVMLHGCGQTGHDLAASTRMNQRATRERFLVLYPEQERLANAQGCWRWFERRRGRADAEADTLLAAIAQVRSRYAVHPDRIAVAGLSAGATMAAWMALRAPALFCAVAMHSGPAPGSADSAASALPAMRGERKPKAPEGTAHLLDPWPPLLLLHGDADSVVALRNARQTAQWWADAVGAREGAASEQKRGARYATRVTQWRARGKAQVVLREVTGLGHAWSGGAARMAYSDPAGPDASALIWAFVARQFAVQVAGGL